MHEPVMVDEIVHHFVDKKGGIILDGTIGSGGHALQLLECLNGQCRIVGIDQDTEALTRARETLKKYSDVVTLHHSNFALFDTVLTELNIAKIDGCILDLGVSLNQLATPERGFSFLSDGPLDMRMNTEMADTAATIVNTYSQDDLANIIYTWGEERNARRIARVVVEERKRKPVTTTTQFAEIVKRAFPKRHYWKIHPATRTFQAIRIAVNSELEQLETALEKLPRYLNNDAIVCVLSFHSLEDRIIKNTFRAWKANGSVSVLTKKPLRPSNDEVMRNKRARSAKLRIAKRSLQT